MAADAAGDARSHSWCGGVAKVRRAFVDEGAIPLVERFTTREPVTAQCAKQALNNLKIPC
jgi:hypothetical protein